MLPGRTSAGVGTLAGAAGVPGGGALASGAIERHTMGTNANLCSVIFTVIGGDYRLEIAATPLSKHPHRTPGVALNLGRLAGRRIEDHQGAAHAFPLRRTPRRHPHRRHSLSADQKPE